MNWAELCFSNFSICYLKYLKNYLKMEVKKKFVKKISKVFFLYHCLKKMEGVFLYQFFLQGLDPFLIASLLVRQLLLGHFFGHLDSLHHLFFCLQMCFFNFCLQPETIIIEIFQVNGWSLANGEVINVALF